MSNVTSSQINSDNLFRTITNWKVVIPCIFCNVKLSVFLKCITTKFHIFVKQVF